ncbi:MAG: DUF600 family protein [Clostridia bacterium]|nr:DUF600 family protein [Clostridia bacterium]
MLKHTKKIKEMYEDIQKRIYYMIPEKWDKMYLYSSVMDRIDGRKTGELFFYYIPKGIFKKKPVNVYEIPQKFNLDEKEYLKLVNILYKKIINLREEFKKIELVPTWTNITIKIEGIQFKVEYDYEDLNKSKFSSYERHIIWRYNNLGIKEEQSNKEEREVLEKYLLGEKVVRRRERYESGIYIKNVQNIVDYDTECYGREQNIEYIATKGVKVRNQIIISKEQMEKMKR